MKKEILFVLLDNFADWEGAYIAPSLNWGVEQGSESKYVVKTVTPTGQPVASCGGLKVLPDYSFGDIPTHYAGLVLIGGMSWFLPEAEAIVPTVKSAVENKKLVAGICNASVFLGMHGFLNEVNHTSNGLEYIKAYGGVGYMGESHYVDAPAVRDGNIVTANGFSALEFAREILYALQADTPKRIEKSYRMNKTGIWEAPEIEAKQTSRFCQSCGMPMHASNQFGSNADGSLNEQYCSYCYKAGAFVQDCTMEGMIHHCVQYVDQFNGACGTKLSKEEAIAHMKKHFPTLKRWAPNKGAKS